MKKVYIKTFGCRVNQVESQSILENFERLGAQICAAPEEADVILFNTCTVTARADKDAEKYLRQALKKAPRAKIVLTGCYAAAHKDKIKAAFPSVTITDKHNLGAELFSDADFRWTVGGHSGHTRAFVKIQDGCDCFCSYCIVPFARPVKTSKPLETTLEEIKNLLKNGFKEIVLTGINIGNYLCPTGAGLDKLLREIFKLEGDFRIRLSSIELNTITDAVLSEAKAGGGKFCQHFHIPLQSGSDAVLKDMRRHYTTEEYAARVRDIRALFDNPGIYADVIAGYPAETEEEFKRSRAFIEKLGLSGLHVFSYSARPGTKAAAMKQLPPAVIKERAALLKETDAALRADSARQNTGKTLRVITEEYDGENTLALAGNFQRVVIKEKAALNTLADVKISAAKKDVCFTEGSARTGK